MQSDDECQKLEPELNVQITFRLRETGTGGVHSPPVPFSVLTIS